MKITIRLATFEDRHGLAALTRNRFSLYRTGQMRDAGEICKVAVDEHGQICGAMVYGPGPAHAGPMPPFRQLKFLGVLPDWRRKGIGRFMLNSLIGQGSLLGRQPLLIRVSADNEIGLKFLDAINGLTRSEPLECGGRWWINYRYKPADRKAPARVGITAG